MTAPRPGIGQFGSPSPSQEAITMTHPGHDTDLTRPLGTRPRAAYGYPRGTYPSPPRAHPGHYNDPQGPYTSQPWPASTPPPGYGYRPGTAAPDSAPVPPRRNRSKVMIAGIGGAVAVIVAAVAVGFTMFGSGEGQDKDQIQALVGDFSTAVDSGDSTAVATYLCAAEAGPLIKGVRSKTKGTSTAPQTSSPDAPTSTVTDIQIHGVSASARVAKPEAAPGAVEPKTLYFAKEKDTWKVCAASKKDFDAAS